MGALMKIDVIVCTKDRPLKVIRAITHINRLIPYEKLIVVDSSREHNLQLEKRCNTYIHTPHARLGYARQKGILSASSPYIAFIDDDVILEKAWFNKIVRNFNNPSIIGVSGNVIMGSHKSIRSYWLKTTRLDERGCANAVFNREKLLEIGGFDIRTHLGEDTELKLRIRKTPYIWVKDNNVRCFHPLSFIDFLKHNSTYGAIDADLYIKYPETDLYHIYKPTKLYYMILYSFKMALKYHPLWIIYQPLRFFIRSLSFNKKYRALMK